MQVYEKRDERHIVLLGYFSAQALQTFLEELYHSDHGCNNFITVILRPDPPSSEILLLIRQSQYISKCVYIQGNPLEEESLKRARAHAAICVIIITKKVYNELAVEEDYTIMQWILSIKSFCKKTKSRQVRVCIQVNSPVSKRMFKFISNYKQSCIDQVICTEELKLKLIAKNCTCPGIITIIASLLTSSIPSIEEPFPNELCDSNKHFAVLSGMQCEIYRVTLKSEVFGGYYFKDLITVLYTQRKVILFALEVDVGQVRKVFVNPADFMLEYKDYYAYLIDVKMPNIANINNVSMSENIKRFDYSIANKSSTSLQYKNIKVEKALPTNQEMIANIKQNYYTYKTHIDYDKIELFDVAEKNIKMHIILCGYISQIEVFISTLRSKILGNKVPAIVILTNDKNIISQWEKIRIYEDIYVVRGSALNVADLDRAGIRTAKVVVILPKKEIYESKNKLGEESETIFIYNTIKNLTQKVRIITEIKEASNISYLLGITEEKNLRKYGYWTTDPLANGELYLSYFLDTLICQSFYNPFIEHIIEQFVLGSSNTTHDEQQIHNSAGLSECALFLFNPLPEHKNSLTYGEIFELLVRKYKMISIGLFKRIGRHSNPIVLIHPPSDIKVNHYDKIFVLYRNEPTMFYDEAKESMDHLGGKTLFDKIKLKKSSNKGLNQAALSSLSQGINLLRNKVKQLHAAIPKI
jgi:potassium large conductance calcium-activated channel subfamily M alpha protein 1